MKQITLLLILCSFSFSQAKRDTTVGVRLAYLQDTVKVKWVLYVEKNNLVMADSAYVTREGFGNPAINGFFAYPPKIEVRTNKGKLIPQQKIIQIIEK
jgi:hypothetical protein